VLIHFFKKRHASKTLRVFVLHWLLFIGNGGKAAALAFKHTKEQQNAFGTENDIINLIKEYESEGISRYLPRRKHLDSLREAVKSGDHVLRPWAERFKAFDDNEHQPGEALRVLSTNIELIKRSLIWLQREYIVKEFRDYNPYQHMTRICHSILIILSLP
jgi:hypothetical protein